MRLSSATARSRLTRRPAVARPRGGRASAPSVPRALMPYAHGVLALHFAYDNFCRVHQTLRVTPAMEARLTDHVWSMEELVSCRTDVTRWRREGHSVLDGRSHRDGLVDCPRSLPQNLASSISKLGAHAPERVQEMTSQTDALPFEPRRRSRRPWHDVARRHA
jgi:hypothetical protein